MHITSCGWSAPELHEGCAGLCKRSGSTISVRQTLIHTGQHYDFNMSDVFFQQLGHAGSGRQPGSRVGQPRPADQPNHRPLRNGGSWNSSPIGWWFTGMSTPPLLPPSFAPSCWIPVAHVEAGSALLRPHDAGGDQSPAHRPNLRPAVHAFGRWKSTTCRGRALRLRKSTLSATS